jgi:hypothetical protein
MLVLGFASGGLVITLIALFIVLYVIILTKKARK